MKVKIMWLDMSTSEYEVKDVGMMPGGVVLKMAKDIDKIVPFNNIVTIDIDKETLCVVVPGSGRAA